MDLTTFVTWSTVLLGLLGIVGLLVAFRRTSKTRPGSGDHVRARALLWTTIGLLCVVASTAVTLLVGPGTSAILSIALPLLAVGLWAFVRASRLGRRAA